jgi:hypothetical protein
MMPWLLEYCTNALWKNQHDDRATTRAPVPRLSLDGGTRGAGIVIGMNPVYSAPRITIPA